MKLSKNDFSVTKENVYIRTVSRWVFVLLIVFMAAMLSLMAYGFEKGNPALLLASGVAFFGFYAKALIATARLGKLGILPDKTPPYKKVYLPLASIILYFVGVVCFIMMLIENDFSVI